MRFVDVALFLAVSVSPTLAQRAPVIVIPGKAGVPVMINGIDASWGVVEGEFGLDRPGAMTPVVTYAPLVVAVPYTVPGYFPQSGRKPGYGRLEVIPPPGPPPPAAPSYFRSWTSESAPGPVTDYPAYPVPPIIVEPRFGHRRNSKGPNHGNP
jgi:hypothetical protein